MGNQLAKQEMIMKKCINKGYIVYRIQDRLFLKKDQYETDIKFEGKNYNEITKKMNRYLKQLLNK